jgi:predicted protein tyrosine phosphatase
MTLAGGSDWQGPAAAVDVVVAGRVAALAWARGRPFAGAISILGPRHHRHNARRKHWARLRALVPELLPLTMDDVADEAELARTADATWLVAPAVHHLDAVFQFARRVPGTLLVHCEQGLSRSGAAAVVVAIARGADPVAAARYLIARDRTYPNEWLIRLADQRCGLGGALERAVDEERRRWHAADPRG